MDEEGVEYKTEVTVTLRRKRYIKTDAWFDAYDQIHYPEKLTESNAPNVSLVGSATNVDNIHLPVLDFDFPCKLVESSTPGHFHLYLDKPMTWDKYRQLLNCLDAARLLNHEWVKKAYRDGKTFVRAPGVKK